MSLRWSPSKYASPWLLAAPLLIGFVLLPGCDKDTYSESMTYPVRRDPVVRDQNKNQEFNEPDPPGMLPLSTFNDIFKPSHLLYKEREAIEKGEKLRDPECLKPEDQTVIKAYLDKAFGTPANPTVKIANAEQKQLDALQLDGETLQHGSHYYRLHCLHCHGLTGDGRGPSGKWVNPHPRDYRQGLFKFQSVTQIDGVTRMPRRADLYRTIHEGIDGTSMPAFNLLSDKDINYLVSYVIHLSIRGQVEYETLLKFDYNSGKDELYWKRPGGIEGFMKDRAASLVEDWYGAEAQQIVPGKYKVDRDNPEEMKASVQRGRDMFLGKIATGGASCVSCHKDYGRQSVYKWDDWGTLGHKPRDLTKGQLRGGRRPIDLYYRIHSGINGSGMNNFGATADKNSDQIWDLVNFVQALPYPAMRKAYGIEID